MDFRPSEEQVLLRRSVREFAETEIGRTSASGIQEQHFPIELMDEAGCARPARHPVPGAVWRRRHVGDRLLHLHRGARAGRSGSSLSVAAHNGLCSSHISLFGSEEQKQKFLVPLARGEKIGAWGLTESTSGSDAAGMRTTAVRAGNCWVSTDRKPSPPMAASATSWW